MVEREIRRFNTWLSAARESPHWLHNSDEFFRKLDEKGAQERAPGSARTDGQDPDDTQNGSLACGLTT